MLSFLFLSFHKDFRDGIQSIEGVMLRGYVDYIVLDEQGIKDRDWSLDIKGLNFEFLFSFESRWWWLEDFLKVGVLEKDFIFKHTILEIRKNVGTL